jgi:hypothetical protein
MARELFVDLTNNRLAVSETNSAPAGFVRFTKGDTGPIRLYFLQATGLINQPFVVVDQSAVDVKFGIGSRTGVPAGGSYTLSFSAETTSDIPAAATAGAVQTALNSLTAISSAGGVSVTGAIEDVFTIRFNSAGTQSAITGTFNLLTPDSIALIDERIEGTATEREVQELQIRLAPAVFQDTWDDLSTVVTATISTVITGSETTGELQRLSFSQKPFAGTYRLTFPSTTLTISSLVTNGVFITPENHGLQISQPVTLTGFSALTGFSNGQQVFVRAVTQPTQFTVSITAGGTALTGSASTGNVFTTLRQTAPITAEATAADVQGALQALDSIGSDGMLVFGIPGQFFDLTFSGAKNFADLPEFTIQNGLTAKPGKTADVDFSSFSIRDLLGNNPSVDLDLEIELTEAGTRQTVVQAGCTVSEELIV